MSNRVAEAQRKRNMEMFDSDLEITMNDIRGLLAHYQIADWEAYLLLRKAGCPDSYVLKYESAAGDGFAQQVVELHRQGEMIPAANWDDRIARVLEAAEENWNRERESFLNRLSTLRAAVIDEAYKAVAKERLVEGLDNESDQGYNRGIRDALAALEDLR